jgi:hypothetical protein
MGDFVFQTLPFFKTISLYNKKQMRFTKQQLNRYANLDIEIGETFPFILKARSDKNLCFGRYRIRINSSHQQPVFIRFIIYNRSRYYDEIK